MKSNYKLLVFILGFFLLAAGVNAACVTPSADAGGYYTPNESEVWCTDTYALRLNFTKSNLYINLNGSTLDCTGFQNCVEWYYLGNLDNNTLDCAGGSIENFEYHGVYITSQSNQETLNSTITDCEITSTLMSTSGGSAIENVGHLTTLKNLNIHDVNNDTSMALPPHAIYLSDGTGARKSLNATIYNVNITNIAANGIKTNDGQGTTVNNTHAYNIIMNNLGLAGAGSGLDINAAYNGLFEDMIINNTASYCGNIGAGLDSGGEIASNNNNITNVTCDNSATATWNFWNATNIYFSKNTYIDEVTNIVRNKPIQNIKFNETTTKTITVTYSGHSVAGNTTILFNDTATKSFNFTSNMFQIYGEGESFSVYNVTSGTNVTTNTTNYLLTSIVNGDYVVLLYTDPATPCSIESNVQTSFNLAQIGISIALLVVLGFMIVKSYEKAQEGELDLRLLFAIIIGLFIVIILATAALSTPLATNYCAGL